MKDVNGGSGVFGGGLPILGNLLGSDDEEYGDEGCRSNSGNSSSSEGSLLGSISKPVLKIFSRKATISWLFPLTFAPAKPGTNDL